MLKTFAAETVPRGETYEDFPVLVRVTGPALENRRPGLDLVLVVHHVQTTWRTKLVSMTRVVKFVIDRLDQKDRLAIVATDTPQPKTVVELTEMNDESRKKLSRKDLGDEDGGVLEKALEQAVKILRDRGDGDNDRRVGCIIILSHDLSHSDTICREFPVHGIELLEGPEYGGSRSFRKLAHMTGGSYWAVHEVDDFVDAVALCLGGLMSLTAMSVEIHVQAKNGVTISSVESGSHQSQVDSQGQSCVVTLNNLYAGEVKNLIIRVTVPEEKHILMTVDGHYYENPRVRISLDPWLVLVQRTTARSKTKVSHVGSHLPLWTGPCPDEVEAELARLRVVRGVDGLATSESRQGRELRKLRDHIVNAKKKLTTPTLLSIIEQELTQMLNLSYNQKGRNDDRSPYRRLWLWSHKCQRETTKAASPSTAGVFRTSKMVRMLQKAQHNAEYHES